MSTPMLSIIIPAYNYAELLPRALASALGQRFVKEVIVVDDGSTDSTQAVAVAMSQEDSRIRYVRQQNAGPSVARNRGLGMASAEYVMLLDADDELVEGAIETLFHMLKENSEVQLIAGRALAVSAETGQSKAKRFTPFSARKEQNFADFLDKKISLSHGRFIARRDLFSHISYPEHIRGAEDLSVYAHLFASANVLSIPDKVVRIYHHDDSLRHNSGNAIENGLKVVDAVFDHSLPVEFNKYRAKFFALRCLSIFRTLHQSGDTGRSQDYYVKALNSYWPVVFKLAYLRKYLRVKFFAS